MLQILFTFYRRFLPVTITISVLFGFAANASIEVSDILAMFWAKIISNFMIGLPFVFFDKSATIFYNNLGYSASKMYWGIMLLDLIIWLMITLVVILLK